MRLLIASRKSDLARLQAYQVGDRLSELGHEVEYHFRQSLGDINQDDPLWKMPEKGVFTEDFREGLELGQWDMVVHSWKDLPIDPLPTTELVATLPRADARDVFLFKKAHLEKVKTNKKLHVYSSSPRRIYNLTPFLKKSVPAELNEIEFSSVRGNIHTRVGKMIAADEVDGLIVAKAALDRLLQVEREEFKEGQGELNKMLSQCLFQVLPLSENPTAAAQGALAIEIRKDRGDLRQALKQIHCENAWQEASKERQILKSHGGGCHQKIGVTCLQKPWGLVTFLRGETEAGETLEQMGLDQLSEKLTNPFKGQWKLFKREMREGLEAPEDGAHFISRSSALPEGLPISEDSLLWASGVKTWEKLAQRGYWVSGCSDGLGEEGKTNIGPLVKADRWFKWTHQKAPQSEDKRTQVSYDLVPLDKVEDHSHFSEYYWMSGTQFERAVELFPSVLRAKHFCGPGHTYKKIQQVLKQHNINQPVVALPHRDVWLSAIKDF